jgi:hypothetical protein
MPEDTWKHAISGGSQLGTFIGVVWSEDRAKIGEVATTRQNSAKRAEQAWGRDCSLFGEA